MHPQDVSVEQTTSEVPIPPTAHGLLQTAHGLPPIVTRESAPTRLTCPTTGARVITTTVSTLTSEAFTSVTIFTRTTNAILPMLGGVPAVHQLIAAYAGVVVGEELRHARAMGPALAAIDWAAHDEDPGSHSE